MQIQQLLKKLQLKIDSKYISLCDHALERMSSSIDDIHDIKHIERLFRELPRLVRSLPKSEQRKINYNVLVTAICWHDVWKSRRFPKNSVFIFIFDQLWDGVGSRFELKKYLRENKIILPKAELNDILHAITAHGGIVQRTVGPRTLEARILFDLDEIDIWSVERVESAARKYLNKKYVNKTTFRIMKLFVRQYILKRNKNRFFFEWTKKQFAHRKKSVRASLEEKIAIMGKMLHEEANSEK